MAHCERCAELEHEIDELKRSIARLTRELRHGDLPVACAVLDAQGTVLEANDALAELLGIDVERARGVSLDGAIAVPSHVDRLREHLAEVFADGHRHACELWIRQPHGAVVPVRVQSVRSEADAARCRSVLIELQPAGAATDAAREPAEPRAAAANGGHGNAAANRSPQPTAQGSAAAPKATVLVVEDESLVRKAVQHYLGAAGYRVLTASDRAGTLACCNEGPIDLVLTDLSLGDGATGPEIVADVRGRWPDTAVLFMTACPPELLARRGFPVLQADTLEKPFSKEKLLARVGKALSAARVSTAQAPDPATSR